MKKILFSLFTFFALASFAQAPQGINYQGVARTPGGLAMPQTNLQVRFTMHSGGVAGPVVFTETQPATTDSFGLYNLVIGASTPLTGVNWSSGPLFLQIEIDPGTGFATIATTQMMSVPYALYAQTAGNGGTGSINGAPHSIPKLNAAGNGIKKSLISESADSSSIGINAPSPNPNAVLDIMNTGAPGAAGKGLLIPRMTLSERTQIPAGSLIHGLIVFQTNSGSITTPQGFWYYDAVAGAWLLLAPAQAVWTLSGNAAGTSGFIGTLDGNDLVFKTGLINAIERMRVLNAGNVQFGNSGNGTHYVFPAVKGGAGDVLQMDPSGTNNLIWATPPSAGAGWLLTGNVGTAGSFLGTTGAFPLVLSTVNTATPQPIQFFTGGAERMRIEEQNGFVGIGTNSPLARLHVTGSSSLGPQVYVQNTAPNQEAAVRVTTPAGGGNIETELNAVDGGSTISQVGRVGTITNHDMTFITGTSKTEYMRITAGGNIGIGTNAPSHKLEVYGASNTALVDVYMSSSGTGNAIQAYTQGGTGVAIHGNASGNAYAMQGIITGGGTGLAGYFVQGSPGATGMAVKIEHSGLGSALVLTNTLSANAQPLIKADNYGTSSGILATTFGAGSAGSFIVNNANNTSAVVNINGNGKAASLYATTTGTASVGVFQLSNNSSQSPALLVNTIAPAPALKVDGSGTVGSMAALFNGGAVAIGTGTVAPTSGLDVKTSIGVSVKKYPAGGTFTIPLNDPNVAHVCMVSGSYNFTLPDATLCPGRLLIFTYESGITGTIVLNTCCVPQTINGGGSQSISMSTTGMSKTSVGLLCDGNNWQVIFKN